MIHKVTVNNQDFKTVLKSTKVGKKLGKANYSLEEVEFRYIAGQLKDHGHWCRESDSGFRDARLECIN